MSYVSLSNSRGAFPVDVRSRFAGQRIRTAMHNVRSHNVPRIPFSLPVLGHYLSLPQFSGVCETLDKQDNIFAGWCGTWSEGTVSIVFASRRLMQILQRHKNVSFWHTHQCRDCLIVLMF